MVTLTKKCELCEQEFEERYPDQRFCSRPCYYEFKKMKKDEKEIKRGPIEDIPVTQQLGAEGIIKTEDMCEICGSPKFCGRCVHFTEHSKILRQPKLKAPKHK